MFILVDHMTRRTWSAILCNGDIGTSVSWNVETRLHLISTFWLHDVL